MVQCSTVFLSRDRIIRTWECSAVACARAWSPSVRELTSLPTLLESADYRESVIVCASQITEEFTKNLSLQKAEEIGRAQGTTTRVKANLKPDPRSMCMSDDRCPTLPCHLPCTPPSPMRMSGSSHIKYERVRDRAHILRTLAAASPHTPAPRHTLTSRHRQAPQARPRFHHT